MYSKVFTKLNNTNSSITCLLIPSVSYCKHFEESAADCLKLNPGHHSTAQSKPTLLYTRWERKWPFQREVIMNPRTWLHVILKSLLPLIGLYFEIQPKWSYISLVKNVDDVASRFKRSLALYHRTHGRVWWVNHNRLFYSSVYFSVYLLFSIVMKHCVIKQRWIIV